MIIGLFAAIVLFWSGSILLLYVWKRALFTKTWREPYFNESPVLIESDDWGPGGTFHAERLQRLLENLAKYQDKSRRSAVLTADVVLSVPDIHKITHDPQAGYHRKNLATDFPEIYHVMRLGQHNGTFVPQLHGMEHLNGTAFSKLCKQQDPRIPQPKENTLWWDWEALDSPLQGHYVDGSALPTLPINSEQANQLIALASTEFKQLFGHSSLSTVAPCYLWNDEIEKTWQQYHIQTIQTAGYRCTGRDATGKYIQDPPIIRFGDQNAQGQRYLIRNVMFEPVDGKNTPQTAFAEALAAHKQALPISISTHRYNYTRSEQECSQSLAGLNDLLQRLIDEIPVIRFLASPELGAVLQNPGQDINNPFNQSQWPGLSELTGVTKLRAFLYRLYFRHPKLVLLSYLTGLIIPAYMFCLGVRRHQPTSA